ncbi:hypothetical protein B4100_1060 [Heyndrickxia coagulans]|nr:hypothetical protein B4100_1060 [Heyndrickxia coagulans]
MIKNQMGACPEREKTARILFPGGFCVKGMTEKVSRDFPLLDG